MRFFFDDRLFFNDTHGPCMAPLSSNECNANHTALHSFTALVAGETGNRVLEVASHVTYGSATRRGEEWTHYADPGP